MYIDDDSWARITPSEVLKSLRLSASLKSSWDKDTSYPRDAEKWTKDNPSIGQCAATSLVAQDILNGVIHKNSPFHHYWNQLPSGAFVDFTHDQFGINEPIASEGKVERKDLLEGERSDNALTNQRYKVLKKRATENLEGLAPTVFLLSSNAQAEYIHDIIESMGVPEGTIMHFRYMLCYIDNALRKLIPVKGKELSNELIDKNSIVIYLNQKYISSGVYKWNDSLPIRMAIIRDCYKTGKADNSITHFFFEVRESLLKTHIYNQHLPQIFGKSFEKAYAFLTFKDTTSLVKKSRSSEVFEIQCDRLKDIGFTFEKGDAKIEYEPPLLILFEGLYRKFFYKSETVVKPKYDASVPKSYYRLLEGGSYRYKFRTYSWEYRKPYEIKLKVSKQLFTTPEEYSLVVKSAYDSECWELTPSFIEQNTNGYMKLEINSIGMENVRQPQPTELDWIISTIFKLERRWFPRILDAFSDLLFVLGPVYIAVTKIYENTPNKPEWIEFWPINLICIYAIWFLAKLVRRLISG